MCSHLEPTSSNASPSALEMIESLIGQMTLEEKVEQLQCAWRAAPFDEAPGFRLTVAPANDRLGIPALVPGEGLHGIMVWPGEQRIPTVFPQAIALGSTWDPELVEAVAQAIALEARALGIHQLYSPVLDVARDPRFGRIEETYGEDPYLVAELGVAFINGLQGRDETRFDAHHVLATAKHFVGYHEGARGINGAAADVSERTIREIHLPPFEAAVKRAGVASIMPAHTDIAGIPCHADRHLLVDVLRDELGFEGFVVSDNRDVARLVEMHRITKSYEQAAATALEAGVDQEISMQQSGVPCYGGPLMTAVRSNLLDEDRVDQAVRRVLKAKSDIGLFGPKPDALDAEQVLMCEQHRALSLEAARRAMVLLRNVGVLPLDEAKTKSIALIGPNADTSWLGGYTGWSQVRPVTVLGGLRKMFPNITVEHVHGCDVTGRDRSGFAEAAVAAGRHDVVVLVLGDSDKTCGEGVDRPELRLPGLQQELLETVVSTAGGKPTVLVLLNGRPPDLSWAAQHVDAILECWYLGVEGGVAIAEALFGRCNPSGKLTVTFPRSVGQVPLTYLERPSFTGSGGGRYADSDRSPLFPFGFGLSYTEFIYENIRLEPSTINVGESTSVTVDITNTGERRGDEVAQLYLHDEVASVTQPRCWLRGFRRVTLDPGETAAVSFSVGPQDLAILNGKLERVVEPGDFSIRVGPDSVRGLVAKLQVEGH